MKVTLKSQVSKSVSKSHTSAKADRKEDAMKKNPKSLVVNVKALKAAPAAKTVPVKLTKADKAKAAAAEKLAAKRAAKEAARIAAEKARIAAEKKAERDAVRAEKKAASDKRKASRKAGEAHARELIAKALKNDAIEVGNKYPLGKTAPKLLTQIVAGQLTKWYADLKGTTAAARQHLKKIAPVQVFLGFDGKVYLGEIYTGEMPTGKGKSERLAELREQYTAKRDELTKWMWSKKRELYLEIIKLDADADADAE